MDILEGMHYRQHILLIGHGPESSDFWILTARARSLMFKNIHGVLFAREDFKSRIEIESNVGVLSSVVLKKSFPDVDYEMLQQFLVYSEFCKRIDDEETLMLIEIGTSNPNEQEEEMDQSSNHSQGLHTKEGSDEALKPDQLTATDGDDQITNVDYFFFPGLVKETRKRLHIWKYSENYSYTSGWCLKLSLIHI